MSNFHLSKGKPRLISRSLMPKTVFKELYYKAFFLKKFSEKSIELGVRRLEYKPQIQHYMLYNLGKSYELHFSFVKGG